MKYFIVIGLLITSLNIQAESARNGDHALALSALAQQYQLSSKELSAIEIIDIYRSDHNEVLHAYFRQHVDGIPVINAPAAIHLSSAGSVISTSSELLQALTMRTPARTPLISPESAINSLAEDRGLATDPAIQQEPNLSDHIMQYSSEILSADLIPIQPVYFVRNDKLHLAWQIVIRPATQAAWWQGWVDAQSGAVLAADNWVDDAQYRVFAVPLESPLDGDRTLETDPQDPQASPFGWHDTDGVIGAEFTDTRGNNVFAQDDLDANNSGGSRPDGGPLLVFDVPLDLSVQQPADYLDFAIINLFYWNSIIHDVLYQYGFDEASGNFQENNYGNGGQGSDSVNADAQDGSGTNNANFGTPPDGSNPRMQMFIFTPANTALLSVNSPASIAADYSAAAAGFGSPLGTGTTSDLELVSDGSAAPSQGCNTLVGFTAGNIAVVDRGGCQFGLKGLNAENAGAVAMVVINNEPGNDVFAMGAGAQGNSVTIPSAMIGNDDGQIIRNELPNVNATLLDDGANVLNRDSDLDAGIIAHEYGHGLSNRLTGGPGSASCLFGSEQQGEGWSDFLALVFTPDASDTADTPRGVGRWATFRESDPAGGIRAFPYTRDMSVNPLTYADIRNAGQPGSPLSIPHGVGTVWATILWDMYWNLVDEYGFDADLYRGNGGNNLAIQLVVDGLKLQPCGPTFVTSRDAILAADLTNNGGQNQCAIWDAFARRGVGICAADGGSPNTLNVTEDFQLPMSCQSDSEVFYIDSFESPNSSCPN